MDRQARNRLHPGDSDLSCPAATSSSSSVAGAVAVVVGSRDFRSSGRELEGAVEGDSEGAGRLPENFRAFPRLHKTNQTVLVAQRVLDMGGGRGHKTRAV